MKRNSTKPKLLDDSASFKIWQLNRRYQRELRAALKEVNLTYTEFVLLAVLFYDLKWQTWSQANLARRAGLDKMVVSQALISLREKQQLLRRPSVLDKREVSLRVSGKGVLSVKRAIELVTAIDKRLSGEPDLIDVTKRRIIKP